MKTQILFYAYALLSVFVGVIACSWLHWKSKRPRATAIAAAIFFGGPLLVSITMSLSAKSALSGYQADVAYMQELCAKYGGDKIYRTVDNVEGVFQMKSYNPDPDKQWADQYGMLEPWALALGAQASSWWLGTNGKGYWFVEQQPGYGLPAGPPFVRTVLISTPNKADLTASGVIANSDGYWLKQQQSSVSGLKSLYGYSTEDLTTPELRKRWIGGGKLKIIDLQTNEVLAERIEYYRATGPEVKMAWAAGLPCPAGPPRATNTSTPGFILAVLRPPSALPTPQQLIQINGR